jgi:hypothetical protein
LRLYASNDKIKASMSSTKRPRRKIELDLDQAAELIVSSEHDTRGHAIAAQAADLLMRIDYWSHAEGVDLDAVVDLSDEVFHAAFEITNGSDDPLLIAWAEQIDPRLFDQVLAHVKQVLAASPDPGVGPEFV